MFQRFRRHPALIASCLGVTAFSCSLPLFGKQAGEGVGDRGSSIPARLSGVLDRAPSCGTGYYQIRLVGLGEETQTQVEAQSDQNGKFTMVAPAGSYQIQVTKGDCGVKQVLHLEGNTEHMVSLSVGETKAIEKADQGVGRLPASVLIEPKR
jgi:hypothetical protein